MHRDSGRDPWLLLIPAAAFVFMILASVTSNHYHGVASDLPWPAFGFFIAGIFCMGGLFARLALVTWYLSGEEYVEWMTSQTLFSKSLARKWFSIRPAEYWVQSARWTSILGALLCAAVLCLVVIRRLVMGS